MRKWVANWCLIEVGVVLTFATILTGGCTTSSGSPADTPPTDGGDLPDVVDGGGETANVPAVIENAPVTPGRLVEVGGTPGVLTLHFGATPRSIPSFDFGGRTVIVVPLLPSAAVGPVSAELTRGADHVRTLSVDFGRPRV